MGKVILGILDWILSALANLKARKPNKRKEPPRKKMGGAPDDIYPLF